MAYTMWYIVHSIWHMLCRHKDPAIYDFENSTLSWASNQSVGSVCVRRLWGALEVRDNKLSVLRDASSAQPHSVKLTWNLKK